MEFDVTGSLLEPRSGGRFMGWVDQAFGFEPSRGISSASTSRGGDPISTLKRE